MRYLSFVASLNNNSSYLENNFVRGKVKNIVIMMGAGVSVSCGIPDYRSKAGLYGSESPVKRLYSDSNGSSVFSAASFRDSPLPFYHMARDLFLPVITGDRTPSLTHYFISYLHQKGIKVLSLLKVGKF